MVLLENASPAKTPFLIEMIVDRGMDRSELLKRGGVSKFLHGLLPSPEGLV